MLIMAYIHTQWDAEHCVKKNEVDVYIMKGNGVQDIFEVEKWVQNDIV